MEGENDDDYDYFNLFEFAASKDCWDIVQLAIDAGCSCSDDVRLQLLDRLSSQFKLYSPEYSTSDYFSQA